MEGMDIAKGIVKEDKAHPDCRTKKAEDDYYYYLMYHLKPKLRVKDSNQSFMVVSKKSIVQELIVNK